MTDEANLFRSACGSVSIWLRQLPHGQEEAQNQLLRRYRDQLVRYAHYRLQQLGVRGKDADDIAQEVFLGLFQRAAAGKIPDLRHRDDLWLKLRRIAGDRIKDARKKKLPFTESAVDLGDDSVAAPGLPQIQDNDLDECLLMVEHDLLRRHLARRHAQLPQIAALKMQGNAVQQIADQLREPKRTIERRLQWIDEICEQYLSDRPMS